MTPRLKHVFDANAALLVQVGNGYWIVLLFNVQRAWLLMKNLINTVYLSKIGNTEVGGREI